MSDGELRSTRSPRPPRAGVREAAHSSSLVWYPGRSTDRWRHAVSRRNSGQRLLPVLLRPSGIRLWATGTSTTSFLVWVFWAGQLAVMITMAIPPRGSCRRAPGDAWTRSTAPFEVIGRACSRVHFIYSDSIYDHIQLSCPDIFSQVGCSDDIDRISTQGELLEAS